MPHLTYYFLGQSLPDSPLVIGAIVAAEKFGFGMGSVFLAPFPHKDGGK